MRHASRFLLWAAAAALLATGACKTTDVSFQNAASTSHDKDVRSVSASIEKPEGAGPFPAVVLLHSCAGVASHLYDWAGFFKARGYAALVVDTFGARGKGACPNGTTGSGPAWCSMRIAKTIATT